MKIGIFAIDCTWLKETIATVTSEIKKTCLELFKNEVYEDMKGTTARFVTINEKLANAPTNPQELHDLSEYVQKVSVEQFTLQQRIDVIMVILLFYYNHVAECECVQKKYNLLEEFCYPIPAEEFQEKWELFGWPQIIKRRISDVEKINQLERLKMIRELRTNQKILEHKIFKLVEEVSEIDSYRELENAINVSHLHLHLVDML